MSRDFHTMESWHQNLTAERLNELIEELNTLTPTPFNERFSINADWIGGRQYLVYNSLSKHVESELGYQLFQGEISNLADWQQQRMWGRVQGLVEFMNGSLDNWYNKTTGVISCDAIIPNDEVIECL